MVKAIYQIVCALVSIELVSAYLVAPPGTAAPGTTSSCSGWVQMSYSLTCAIIESYFGLTETEFEEWIDFVAMSTGFPTTLTTSTGINTPSTTASTDTATTTGDGISTPSPIQTGMVSNCNKFYLVASGDTCAAIATAADISLSSFYAWNPAVGSTCATLDLGDYVCIGVIGSTTLPTTSSAFPTSSTVGITTIFPSNGIPTPTPYQTGMVTNCDKFHLVASGDQCGDLATEYDISLAQFYSWNPAVGTSCQYLDLDDYVCVGVETCTSASVLAGQPQSGLICGAPGASHDNSGSLLITSYTTGSPYVESAAACGAQCLATPDCTNLYFIEGSYCNLHEGSSTFAESTETPFYYWYSASCFTSGDACGSYGFSNDTLSTLIISYTSGSSYVESAAACGTQCLSTSQCTNVYFIQGSYCNLHSPSSFYASTESGYYSWYQLGCFACNALAI